MRGFRELERALVDELPKVTARTALRRGAVASMEPMRQAYARNAPYDPQDRDGDGRHLNETMRTEVLSARRVKSVGGPSRAEGLAVMTGPAPKGKRARNNAHWQEDGTVRMPANGYARRSVDEETGTVIDGMRDHLAAEVERARKRIARKAARGG